MSQDTNVNNLIINKLTKAQYDNIQNPSATELYLVTDDIGITSSEIATILGYTPESVDNKVTSISSSSTDTQYPSAKAVYTQLNTKQAKLVSGTNIKTINNNSILGSGNITIDSLPSQSGQSGKFLTTNGTTASWSNVSIPTVDQTFDGTSANAQSGVAIAGELNNYQSLITSSAMLSSDLVDDTNHTHKFATSAQLTQIGTNQTDISTINGKIPSQASTSNQLADKAFVNSSVQTATANFRGNWDTWALVPTSASSYPADYAGNTTPTVNDYLVVQDASDYTGDTLEGTWRFKYTGTWSTDGKSGWNPEYQVNETPLTSAQLAALNSGITSSDVTLIGTALQPGDLPTNHVTTDTDQDITGTKTFVGQKKIGFKQSSSSDKLGFTLYNNSGTEKGYLEYNPSNTVDSVPLMTLGNYASASGGLTHVGFRKYSSISGASGAYNLLAPLISDARTPFSLTTTYTNFYLPLGFTDGTTTVKTAKSGMVDISSLLPDVSNFVTNSSLATTLSSYATQSWVGQQGYLTSIPSSYLQNTATGTNSLTLLGTATSSSTAINIGYNSSTTTGGTVAIGTNASASGTASISIGANTESSGIDTIAIGDTAKATANNAIQIGYGTNNTANKFNVRSFELLDIATGLIPDARISSNIARTSAIPDVSSYLQNTATGTNSLTILGTATSYGSATNIGKSSTVTAIYGTALGYGASVSGDNAIALGVGASATRGSALQIGYGTNSTANTLNIGFYNDGSAHYNWQLLDGTTGLIPDARISSNIARTSAIPTVNNATLTIQKNGTTVNTFTANASSNVTANITVPTKTSDITNDSNFVQNTATSWGSSLTLLGTATTSPYAINIGFYSSSEDDGAVALGYGSAASGSNSTALGYSTWASGSNSIQIGYGTNSTANTLSVGFYNQGNYQLLDGTTGLIPDARISTNIARTSALDSKVNTSDIWYDSTSKTLYIGVAQS